MVDGWISLDMDKISQWLDYIIILVGDDHLPTTLNEIKKSIEEKTTSFSTINQKVQLLE